MVVSNKVYTPQTYLEALFGVAYCFTGENVRDEIHRVLRMRGANLRDYQLQDIKLIVKIDAPVVLVDVSGFKDGSDLWVNEFRWFEVPEDFKED